MVEIFGYKLFGCKTKRSSRRKRRSYKGGYKYKQSGNNAGEDVSNLTSSRKRKMDISNSGSGMGKGTKRRRMR